MDLEKLRLKPDERRRRADSVRYIEAATGPWIDCPVGITAREKADPPKTRVQEVASAHTGLRIFVVRSDERERYERAQRLNAMERVKTQLDALQRRVDQGKLKAADKIGAAAARILARHHGHRYYAWDIYVLNTSSPATSALHLTIRAPAPGCRFFPFSGRALVECAEPAASLRSAATTARSGLAASLAATRAQTFTYLGMVKSLRRTHLPRGMQRLRILRLAAIAAANPVAAAHHADGQMGRRVLGCAVPDTSE